MVNLNDLSFGSKISPRLGLELEYILPFNNNRWSILLEPTYQSYAGNESEIALKYSSLEIPFGVRRYFFLKKESTLFINAGLVTLDFYIDASVDFESDQGNDFELTQSADVWSNLFVGFGYKHKKQI